MQIWSGAPQLCDLNCQVYTNFVLCLYLVRYARKAQSLLDGFLDATVVTDFVDAPPTDSPDSIDFDALAKFLADSSILPGGASSFLPQAQAKREVTAPKAHATASADRRRRRTESLPGRRQASRAPSGT
ncbi:unnamed protein product, partial [Allacma fusca]